MMYVFVFGGIIPLLLYDTFADIACLLYEFRV